MPSAESEPGQSRILLITDRYVLEVGTQVRKQAVLSEIGNVNIFTFSIDVQHETHHPTHPPSQLPYPLLENMSYTEQK